MPMRYLAIDYGLKRTGLAFCDVSETICSPHSVIDQPKNLIKQISEIVKTEGIKAIIIGLPLNMDGSEGRQSELVKKFAEKLKARVTVPIHFQDERLSSFAAEEKLDSAQMTRAQKKKHLDAVAAAHILETFLKEQNSSSSRQ